MFKIGTVNIDTSHAPSFAEILLKEERARYTAVYNDAFRTDEEVSAFIEKFGLEKRYDSLEELAKNVDIGFIQGCNWDRHIECMMPFINAGKPVFVDKPIVGNYADCLKVEKLVADGAVILGSSALRYTYEHDEFFAIPEETRGEIKHITTTVGVDNFNYAIHSVESIMGFMRDAHPISTRYIDCNADCETYYVIFDNGVSACYHTYLKSWQPSTATVITSKTTHAIKIDTNKVYEAMLKQVCNYLEGKENLLVSIDKLTESVKIMLAGKKSKENGGKTVLLTDLSTDDIGYDGAAFEKEYAAAQRK